MSKRAAGFNTPFAELAKKKLKPQSAASKKQSSARRTSTPAATTHGDDDMFREAMHGVSPIRGAGRVSTSAPKRPVREVDDDAEALAELAELVAGDGEFDFTDTSEYVEGAVVGLDPRIVARLRRGEFTTQATLDLHRLTRDEARRAVGAFVERERAAGHRSVLIVHGRGLHSRDHVPVLKEELKVWLARGRAGRAILAFSSARPCDGGTGALYVLLRRSSSLP